LAKNEDYADRGESLKWLKDNYTAKSARGNNDIGALVHRWALKQAEVMSETTGEDYNIGGGGAHDLNHIQSGDIEFSEGKAHIENVEFPKSAIGTSEVIDTQPGGESSVEVPSVGATGHPYTPEIGFVNKEGEAELEDLKGRNVEYGERSPEIKANEVTKAAEVEAEGERSDLDDGDIEPTEQQKPLAATQENFSLMEKAAKAEKLSEGMKIVLEDKFDRFLKALGLKPKDLNRVQDMKISELLNKVKDPTKAFSKKYLKFAEMIQHSEEDIKIKDFLLKHVLDIKKFIK
jgi:hypothetical protein